MPVHLLSPSSIDVPEGALCFLEGYHHMLETKEGLGKIKEYEATMLKKQTVFFVQTADVWTTSSPAELCRCGPQTADVLTLKKQTEPK
ncbi:hypothetical protein LXL04_021240 [Taraxacum kok-saghyz]